MKTQISLGLICLSIGTSVHALGVDRSAQGIGALFEDGNYATISLARVRPSTKGEGNAPLVGDSGNVTRNFNLPSLTVKYNFNEKLSGVVIVDEPYGADLFYPTTGNGWLNGTKAQFDANAVTGLLRYKFNENLSIHGGLRYQTLQQSVVLKGAVYQAAFGPQGYEVDFAKKGKVGYAVGAAYERPDIALRVALTHFTGINYDQATTERIGGGVVNSVTRVRAPTAWNLDLQTGIAKDTLVFGSIRWADYESVRVKPKSLGGASLINFKNEVSYSVGIGRKLSENFSGFIAFGIEKSNKTGISTPLSPTNGCKSITLGSSYKLTKAVDISGSVTHIKQGDVKIFEGSQLLNTNSGNSALAVGIRLGYRF
jgi:long-chain fatty acid transport protein